MYNYVNGQCEAACSAGSEEVGGECVAPTQAAIVFDFAAAPTVSTGYLPTIDISGCSDPDFAQGFGVLFNGDDVASFAVDLYEDYTFEFWVNSAAPIGTLLSHTGSCHVLDYYVTACQSVALDWGNLRLETA